MEDNNQEKTRKRLLIVFALSLILHIGFFVIKWEKESSRQASREDLIEVSVDDIEKYKEQIAQAKARAKNANTEKKQIVNNELHGREETPTDSKFLGEKNQVYDRQTTASKVDIFNKAGMGERNATTQVNSPRPEIAKANSAKPAGVTKDVLGTGKSKPKKISLSDLAFNAQATDDLQAQEKRAFKDPNPGRAQGIKNGDVHSRGLASNNDYLQNLPLGDFTHLNTTEFKYYGFYHRIRQKLEQFWGDSIREKAKNLYAQGRRVPASDDLVTTLMVSINNKGEITSVKMLGTSGIKELDDAAVESFNKAGPFPNPPTGMIKDGVATIEWGFVVKS